MIVGLVFVCGSAFGFVFLGFVCACFGVSVLRVLVCCLCVFCVLDFVCWFCLCWFCVVVSVCVGLLSVCICGCVCDLFLCCV